MLFARVSTFTPSKLLRKCYRVIKTTLSLHADPSIRQRKDTCICLPAWNYQSSDSEVARAIKWKTPAQGKKPPTHTCCRAMHTAMSPCISPSPHTSPLPLPHFGLSSFSVFNPACFISTLWLHFLNVETGKCGKSCQGLSLSKLWLSALPIC